MAPSRRRQSGGDASPPLPRELGRSGQEREHVWSLGVRPLPAARRRGPGSERHAFAAPRFPFAPHSGMFERVRQMCFYLRFSLLFKSGRKAAFWRNGFN